MICAEIRRRFGVPVESLAWIQTFMRKPPANHLDVALEVMSRGMCLMLLTDLKTTFVLDADLEVADLMHTGYFRNENSEGFILLKMNPLVNRLLACRKEPVHLPIRVEFYKAIQDALGIYALGVAKDFSEAEHAAFKLIRDGSFQSVTVHLKNGGIRQIDAEREHVLDDVADVLKLLKNRDYQTLTVAKVDGKVVRIRQKIPRTFSVKSVRQKNPEGRDS
jgi:hypothetical protein